MEGYPKVEKEYMEKHNMENEIPDSIILIDEFDEEMEDDFEEEDVSSGEIFSSYSQLIDIETLAADVNKLTNIRKVKKRYKTEAEIEGEKTSRDREIAEGHEEFSETRLESIPGEDGEAEKLEQEKINVLAIELPEGVSREDAEKLKIDDISGVNLKEAEEIAREDIFFIAGDDFKEELEELEIVQEEDEDIGEAAITGLLGKIVADNNVKPDEKQEKAFEPVSEEIIEVKEEAASEKEVLSAPDDSETIATEKEESLVTDREDSEVVEVKEELADEQVESGPEVSDEEEKADIEDLADDQLASQDAMESSGEPELEKIQDDESAIQFEEAGPDEMPDLDDEETVKESVMQSEELPGDEKHADIDHDRVDEVEEIDIEETLGETGAARDTVQAIEESELEEIREIEIIHRIEEAEAEEPVDDKTSDGPIIPLDDSRFDLKEDERESAVTDREEETDIEHAIDEEEGARDEDMTLQLGGAIVEIDDVDDSDDETVSEAVMSSEEVSFDKKEADPGSGIIQKEEEIGIEDAVDLENETRSEEVIASEELSIDLKESDLEFEISDMVEESEMQDPIDEGDTDSETIEFSDDLEIIEAEDADSKQQLEEAEVVKQDVVDFDDEDTVETPGIPPSEAPVDKIESIQSDDEIEIAIEDLNGEGDEAEDIQVESDELEMEEDIGEDLAAELEGMNEVVESDATLQTSLQSDEEDFGSEDDEMLLQDEEEVIPGEMLLEEIVEETEDRQVNTYEESGQTVNQIGDETEIDIEETVEYEKTSEQSAVSQDDGQDIIAEDIETHADLHDNNYTGKDEPEDEADEVTYEVPQVLDELTLEEGTGDSDIEIEVDEKIEHEESISTQQESFEEPGFAEDLFGRTEETAVEDLVNQHEGDIEDTVRSTEELNLKETEDDIGPSIVIKDELDDNMNKETPDDEDLEIEHISESYEELNINADEGLDSETKTVEDELEDTVAEDSISEEEFNVKDIEGPGYKAEEKTSDVFRSFDDTLTDETDNVPYAGIEDDLNLVKPRHYNYDEMKINIMNVKKEEDTDHTTPGPDESTMKEKSDTIEGFEEDDLQEIDIEILGGETAGIENILDTGADEDIIEDESVSGEIKLAEKKRENVFIISDEPEIRESRKEEVISSNEEKLDAIVTGIVDLIRGEARELGTADVDEDMYIKSDTPINFEDFHVETEDKYRFIDNELDFIDNLFISKDIKEVKEESAEPDKLIEREKISTGGRIAGISIPEFDSFEDNIFGTDYKEVDFTRDLDIIEDITDRIVHLDKKLTYILPETNSLSEEEKKSIEEDIKSSRALIFEEDVEEIKRRLGSVMEKKIIESFQDITDSIRIIEDEEELRESIKRLLEEDKEKFADLFKHINGLMDKLPEDERKQFAETEYYDIYLKIIKELKA